MNFRLSPPCNQHWIWWGYSITLGTWEKAKKAGNEKDPGKTLQKLFLWGGKHIRHNQNDRNNQSGVRKLSQDLCHPAWEIVLQCFPNDFEHPIFATEKKRGGWGVEERNSFKTYVKTMVTARKWDIFLKHHLSTVSDWEPNLFSHNSGNFTCYYQHIGKTSELLFLCKHTVDQLGNEPQC